MINLNVRYWQELLSKCLHFFNAFREITFRTSRNKTQPYNRWISKRHITHWQCGQHNETSIIRNLTSNSFDNWQKQFIICTHLNPIMARQTTWISRIDSEQSIHRNINQRISNHFLIFFNMNDLWPSKNPCRLKATYPVRIRPLETWRAMRSFALYATSHNVRLAFIHFGIFWSVDNKSRTEYHSCGWTPTFCLLQSEHFAT